MAQLKTINHIQGSLGFVVPTLGLREQLLSKTIASLIAAGVDSIVVVGPESLRSHPDVARPETAFLVESPESRGAAAAINQGLKVLMSDERISFVAWLGDDDELIPEGFRKSRALLCKDSALSAVIGNCEVQDDAGRTVMTLTPSVTDVALLEFKTNKIPQPGSIFSKRALERTGLLDENLKYAFDQDLFHRLKKVGPIAINNDAVAIYRWIEGSLSRENSEQSIHESFLVRLRFCPKHLRFVTRAHYFLVRLALRFISPRLRG